MLTITRNDLLQSYQDYQKTMKLFKTITFGSCICGSLLFLIGVIGQIPALKWLGIFCDLIALAAYFPVKKKLIPPGNGQPVQQVMQSMRYDLTSDNIVNLIYKKIGETSNYPDKCKLILLLANCYELRGQPVDAVNACYMIDRTQFINYPSVGLDYYQELLSIYDYFEDYDNLRAAYADAEGFAAQYYNQGYIYCSICASIVMYGNIAYGRYREALDLHLAKNEISGLFRSSTASAMFNGTPMQRLIIGSEYLGLAKLYLKCGDLENAALNCDKGGPIVAFIPSQVQEANKLSQRIREAKEALNG